MTWLRISGLVLLLAGLPLLFVAFGLALAKGARWFRKHPRAFAVYGMIMGVVWLIMSALLFADGTTPFRAWGNLAQGVIWLALGLSVWLWPEFWTGRRAGQDAGA